MTCFTHIVFKGLIEARAGMSGNCRMDNRFTKFNLVLKRVFDLVSSTVAIVVLIPVWIGVSFAIKKESKGTIFFKQDRRTKDGQVFQILKFRSMVADAEKKGTGLFNYINDPRVTGVGRKLRNTSIDELPQLFNIIKGDMSVIGPRPCVIYELGEFETLNKRYMKRFKMKAGLTGWAQVKGRNNISWDEKVGLDNEYIDLFIKYGVLIDIFVLIKSMVNIFRKENIFENKIEGLDNAESAKIAEEEIIRIAHLPD